MGGRCSLNCGTTHADVLCSTAVEEAATAGMSRWAKRFVSLESGPESLDSNVYGQVLIWVRGKFKKACFELLRGFGSDLDRHVGESTYNQKAPKGEDDPGYAADNEAGSGGIVSSAHDVMPGWCPQSPEYRRWDSNPHSPGGTGF